jgi:transposase-like protein
MTAPVLAVGDGALGFWGALGEVFPETVHQRCWVHKMANVMNALPKSAQPAARAALKEVRDAEDREHAEKALDSFVKEYEAKWPKATEKVAKDKEELLAFYAFPAEHWVHLKTTNPIVIYSHPEGVHDVVDGPLFCLSLCAGCGYLQPSSTQVRGRFGVRSAGGVGRFAA